MTAGRGGVAQGRNEARHAVEKVFGVVQHQQRGATAQGLQHGLGRVLGAIEHQPERARHGVGDERRVAQRCQLHPPHASAVLRLLLPRHAARQYRLADTTGAGHRDQPMLLDQPVQSHEIVVATVQTRRRRQINLALRFGRGRR